MVEVFGDTSVRKHSGGASMNTLYEDSLTGRTRHRVMSRLFYDDAVVVQVEVNRPNGPEDYNGVPIYPACTFWRDATPDDMMRLKEATA